MLEPKKLQKERIVKMGKKQETKSSKASAKTGVKTSVKVQPKKKKTTPTIPAIKKEYKVKDNQCRVTFRLAKAAAPNAKKVCVVGDFNGWDFHANPMKKAKTGVYSITLDLEPGKEYQFRYLIDESEWANHWNADKYVKSPFGDSENSVVVT